MSKCRYLIDISPYTPLCEHPCRLYGGGPVEAKCDACEYRTESLEAENAKLRELMYERAHVYAIQNMTEDELTQRILARLGYVQVVRCGECKYDTLDHTDHNYRETRYCGFHRMDVKPDCYCVWGERKEDK